MKKVRSAYSSTNPAVMFAQGVEQIVSDHIDHPTDYHDYELNEMIRKEQYNNAQSLTGTTSKRWTFSIVNLLKGLAWKKNELNS